MENLLGKYTKPICISGIGGYGKSSLAKLLAFQCHSKYNHVAWINALGDPMPAFMSDVHLLAYAGMDEEINDSAGAVNSKSVFLKMLRRLNDLTDEYGLIVIDDVNSVLLDYMPDISLAPNWHVILTSREEIAQCEVYLPQQLSKAQAIQIFKLNYTKDKTYSNEDISFLVESMWRHPLAIEVLAKTANAHPGLNVKRLRNSFELHGLFIPEEIPIETDYKNLQQSTISACLDLAFDISGIRDKEPNLRVLKEFSLVPPIPIDSDDLYKLMGKSFDDTEFATSVIELEKYGWVSVDRSESGNRYYVHPVIQETIKRKFDITYEDLGRLTAYLNTIFIPEKYKEINLNLYSIFIENLLSSVTTEDGNYVLLCHNMGRFYNNINRMGEGLKWLKKAAELIEHADITDEKEAMVHAQIYHDMCRSLRLHRDHDELNLAHSLCRKAIRTIIMFVDPAKWSTILPNMYNTLAQVNRTMRRHKASEYYYQQAVNFANLKKDDELNERLIPTIYDNLGCYYRDIATPKNMEAVKKSEYYFLLTLNLRVKLLEKYKSHARDYLYRMDLGNSYNNYSMFLSDRGNHRQALENVIRTLKLYKENAALLNEDFMNSRSFAVAYQNMAKYLKELGRLKFALKYQMLALSIKENVYAGHPMNITFAVAYDVLGEIYFLSGDDVNANKCIEKAISIYEFNNRMESVAQLRAKIKQ